MARNAKKEEKNKRLTVPRRLQPTQFHQFTQHLTVCLAGDVSAFDAEVQVPGMRNQMHLKLFKSLYQFQMQFLWPRSISNG